MTEDTVLVRIRRMGKQWATTGIGIRPPANEMHNPSMKGRCAKLVPGQVVRLPRNHSILRNVQLVEVVAGPEDDEFIRPWVFSSVEAAKQADPSLSGMTPESIASALALTEGATYTQRQALAEREASARETDMPVPAYGDRHAEADRREPAYEPDDGYTPDPNNRLVRDDAVPTGRISKRNRRG